MEKQYPDIMKNSKSNNATFPNEVIMGVEKKLRYDTSKHSPVYFWRNLGVNASKWLYMNFGNLKEDNKIKVCLKILDKLAPDQVHVQGQAGLQGLLAEMSRRAQELNIEEDSNVSPLSNDSGNNNMQEDIENKEDTII